MFPAIPNIPIQEIKDEVLTLNNVSLFIKREDLIHPEISGNKWRKLKYNFEYFAEKGFSEIVTFGGAFSNHIAATAAAGKICGVKTVGVIRGEPVALNNSTLSKAIENGMDIRFISREAYKEKNTSKEFFELTKDLENPYVIPEGGANRLGLLGCKEITEGIEEIDLFVAACGTGNTVGGMIAGASEKSWVQGIPVLKGMNTLAREIDDNLFNLGIVNSGNWSLNHDYHFGGYAKATTELTNFISAFWKQHKIKLDPIYTGKAMFGLFDQIKSGAIQNKRIMFVHTGGLQGVKGFEDRYSIDLFGS